MRDNSFYIADTAKGTTSLENIKSTNEDYTELLATYTTKYKVDDTHIHIGIPQLDQGWLLHISIIVTQMKECLHSILPELLLSQLPFKIVKNRKIHSNTNDGYYGNFKIGKIITIYLDKEEAIIPLVEKLILLTDSYIGPQIISDFPIHNVLYTRFGSFISIIDIDSLGNKVRLIKDLNGRLIFDKYYLPPIIPQGMSNPFLPIIERMPKPPKIHLIGKKYMPVKLLKSDIKGDVYKALYFTKLLLPKWCVLKQGKKGMFLDNYNRDARDRIKWQYKVGKLFYPLLATPMPIDYWEDHYDSYLSLQFIKRGRDLKWVIAKISERRAWFDQSLKIKTKLLDYLLQILKAIDTIHKQNYVHRDITGTNFLITRNNKVKLIDLELIYSINDKEPCPPFQYGTVGYMSPEQRESKEPHFNDDIFAIGSLMILFFTAGVEPVHLLDSNHDWVRNKLVYLIKDINLVNLIMKCISVSPTDRPNIEFIHETITNYKTFIKTSASKKRPDLLLHDDSIKKVIQQSINMFSSDLMTHKNKWFSQVENEYGIDVYPLLDKDIFGGIYRGVGGPIWLLGQLNQAGFDISKCTENITHSLEFIKTDILSNLEKYAPSLYYGKTGFATVLSSALQNNFISDSTYLREKIQECFLQTANSHDIIYGVSGQGLAAIQCAEYLDANFFYSILHDYTKNICDAQLGDGSWSRLENENAKGKKETGFGYGISGIIYYLLEYSQYNPTVISHAEKSLHYLSAKIIKQKKYYSWLDNDTDRSINIWWCKGGPGIALAYLKAYEITKIDTYREIAEKALLINPTYIVHHALSQCHGLSGLGEIYLEAFRITKNTEWWERASWIANLLLNFKKEGPNDSIYWIVDRPEAPNADFMIGNGGILHFLARYYSPEKIGFPFFPKH